MEYNKINHINSWISAFDKKKTRKSEKDFITKVEKYVGKDEPITPALVRSLMIMQGKEMPYLSLSISEEEEIMEKAKKVCDFLESDQCVVKPEPCQELCRYILYKIMEWNQMDTRQEVLRPINSKHDIWWKQCCDHYNWDYKDTS